ncbi:hypothetical protein MSAN_00920700 [Mycena sanguinolenta]|uniref:Uncharacterized protein n=1 Tax=Mycena sanguinolenta TaxID=230812 RepID=A0A8H7DC35_9AGAR|nr:hypothetical protein MSAN_00920700 [Mycena sanguinolenta]
MFLSTKYFALLAAGLAINFQAAEASLGAYFCNDINFTNNRAHWTKLVENKCYTLDASHQNSFSSFGPDSGTVCILSPGHSCNFVGVAIEYPGSGDLREIFYTNGPTANDNVNSFECFSA